MKKGFYSRRLIAALMAALLSVNSLPVTVLAEETDLAGQSQVEAVMESDTEGSDLAEESQEESVTEETSTEETEDVLQSEEQSYELVDSGTCGENVTWTLDSEGLLTITGTGDMTNYTSSSECPWYSESASIVSIVVGDDVTNIGNYAFENLGNLTTATLGSSVTTIGESAFYSCSSLISINIPDNAKTIERGAFYGCRSLESIAIPDSVTTIGGSTFYGCSSLTSVNIPNGVTRIGWGMFYGCSGLTNIAIPKNVEYIENDAFSYCSNLSEINFECSVPVIWDESFYQVTATAYYPANDTSWTEDVRKNYGGTLTWKAYDRNVIDSGTCGENVTWTLEQNGVLTISGTGEMADYSEADQWSWYEVRDQIVSIVIKNGVENIGNNAFYSFSNLTSVDISDSVISIDSGAFEYCSSLEEIDIPSSMCYIADDAFLGCTSLKAINVEEGTINYSSKDGVLFSGSKTLIYCPGAGRQEYIIPEGTLDIGEYAFSDCSDLTSVEIPNSVTEIGSYAFAGCSSLKEIVIPSRVISIGQGAFNNCGGLKTITFEGLAPEFTEKVFDGVAADVYYPADDASWTEEVRQDCGGTLTWISYEAKDIIDSGTCGGKLAWKVERNGVLSITGTGAMTDYLWEVKAPWHAYGKHIVSIVIDNGVTNIGDYAFYGFSKMTEMNIPDSVTKIGDSAFQACVGLTAINIPNEVTDIGTFAFCRCSSLTSIDIPSKVRNIGDDAFYRCRNLSVVNVEEENERYYSKEGALFAKNEPTYGLILIYCPGNGRERYIIPDGVITIDSSAFCDCTSLTNVEISDSVICIKDRAFDGCRSLSSINIPSSVTYVGDYAFADCTNLSNITFEGSIPDIKEASFSDVTAIAYYPENDLSWTEEERVDYGGTLTWESYISDKDTNSGTCGENVFWRLDKNGCLIISGNGEMSEYNWEKHSPWYLKRKDVTSIVIENGVTYIGCYAFENLYNLKNVEIPNSVSVIGWNAFSGCSNLKNVEIPDSVYQIGTYAFGDCESLEKVVIGSSVNIVQWGVFNGCSSLKNITFEGSAPDFEEIVFDGVTATVYYLANDSSWTEEVRQNYGGTLTWVAKDSKSEEKELTIIQQPESVTGKLGETAVFTVEAEGDGVTYQWQYCNNGSSTWKNSSMTGSTTNSIEVKITKGRIGQKYRCIIQDNRDNKLVSEEALIMLAEEKELAITKQPESATGKIGETAVFTVEAEGEGVTYQWQYCNSGSSAWKNSSMTGSTTNSIEVKITKGRIGQRYRCILKDSKGNKLTTEEAQIIQAEEKKLAVIQQPESVTGKIGERAVFTVEAEGEGVTYQWQYCNSGSSAWKNSSMTGSTTNSIEVKITKGRIGQKYRCILKDSKGNKLATEEAQIKLAEEKELAIVKQPESVTGKVGGTAVFTVEAEGEGVTYQWQYCNSGSTSWANSKMTGFDTNSIEVKITKGRIGQKYRCILKDSKGNKLTTEEAQIIQAEK